ncbi:hypothetical protein Hanom_Chr00s028288g01767731 [Helianthus anomalus]
MNPPSSAMTSNSWKCNKSCLIRPPKLVSVCLYSPLQRVSTILTLTMVVTCLLLTSSHHLNFPSLILSDILATPNISLKISFLILFLKPDNSTTLLIPHIMASNKYKHWKLFQTGYFLHNQSTI